MRRAAFYIDGFNIYHGIRELGDPRLKWVNYFQLAQNLVEANEKVVQVKLFSATPHLNHHSRVRHQVFQRAQLAVGVEVIEGKWKSREKFCGLCKQTFRGWEEKESDVNMAIHLVQDAFLGQYDIAYLLSSDSDLTQAAQMVKTNFSEIKLVSVNSPGRKHAKDLLRACSGLKKTLHKDIVEGSRLPDEVYNSEGKLMARIPPGYK